MILIFGIILSSYLGLALLLFLFQMRLIYLPTRTLIATPDSVGLAYEEVQLQTKDGLKLFGWFVPAEEAENVLLFLHGNAGNISDRIDMIAQFHRLGFSVFIFDYRGYGHSEGVPNEAGTYLDADAAWHYLVEQRQIDPGRIIIFGRSLGGGMATWLAQHRASRALVLECTFTSIPNIGAKQYPFLPVHLLARVRYNNLKRISKINVPVLIVHSPTDETIPFDHGRQLFDAAPNPKMFLEIQGGHADGSMVSAAVYEAGWRKFMADYLLK